MSLQMKVARAGNQGDPGLFGFLGGALKGIAKGALGSIGIGSGGGFGAGGMRPMPSPRGPTVGRLPIPQGVPRGIMPRGPGIGGGIGGAGRALIPFGAGAAAGAAVAGGGGNGKACEQGSKPNKSKYYVERDIFGVPTGGISIVEPGERCVKRRRMNPLNPRALSRSIRRVESAKRATKHLSRITIRGRGCGCK